MNQRNRFVFLAAFLLFLFFVIDQAFFRQLPVSQLTIQKSDGTSAQFEVEITHSAYQRERGFMYRLHIPRNQGMLFTFDREQILSFWMKNTFVPLDMIFIDRNGTIVGIVENAKPRDETPRGPDVPALSVLELHGGVAAEQNIQVGDKVASKN